jgi:hypothetical protein
MDCPKPRPPPTPTPPPPLLPHTRTHTSARPRLLSSLNHAHTPPSHTHTLPATPIQAYQWAFAICLVLQLVSMALKVAYFVELGRHGVAESNVSDVALAFSHGVLLCTLMLM